MGTRLFAWIGVTFALAFLAAGLAFRIASGGSLSQCLFARPDCSTAAGTWFLGAVTSAAFLAAYEAAMKAGEALRVSQQTYELETVPVLGVAMCWEKKHARTRRLFLYGDRVAESVPTGLQLHQFLALDFVFENLGRTSLLDLTVWLKVDESQHKVYLGNIGPEKETHISLMMIWDTSAVPRLEWLSPAICNDQDLNFKPLGVLLEAALSKSPTTKPTHWNFTYISGEAP